MIEKQFWKALTLLLLVTAVSFYVFSRLPYDRSVFIEDRGFYKVTVFTESEEEKCLDQITMISELCGRNAKCLAKNMNDFHRKCVLDLVKQINAADGTEVL